MEHERTFLTSRQQNVVGCEEDVRDAILYGHLFRSEETCAINVALSLKYCSIYNRSFVLALVRQNRYVLCNAVRTVSVTREGPGEGEATIPERRPHSSERSNQIVGIGIQSDWVSLPVLLGRYILLCLIAYISSVSFIRYIGYGSACN
jgi:hypothetical protein